MYKKKRILGLIPARGGSKGLPRKNIKLLAGKPLIAWTIKQAKMSQYIDRIVVSTDDEEIAEVSKKYGAEVPFKRPSKLATDKAGFIDFVLHAMDTIEKNDKLYDILVFLQPTSPLRLSEDIDRAIGLLFKKKASSIISVCKSEHHPLKAGMLPADRCMKDFIKKDKNRQELGTFYRLNGAIFLAYWDYIRKQKSFFGNETFAYIMPQNRSVDIDSEVDFKLAEILKKTQNNFK